MAAHIRRNSFDAIRFVAATGVVLSHSYPLVGLIQPHIGNATLGGFSVWIFFILSGYLISLSWKQYPRFNVFMVKRVLRIFPGLIVAIIVSVVVLSFFSTLPVGEYFTHPQTLSYFNNILLLNTHYSLPGVFTDNVYPSAVNGSIWTLAYEFIMYIAVAVLGVLSLLRKNRIEYIWALLLIANIISILYPKIFSFSLLYLDMRLVVQMGLMFFSGVMLQMYDSKISYKKPFWLVALVLFFIIAARYPAYTPVLAGTLLSFGAVGLGKLPYLSSFGKYGDFSYGIYVYSFPVQQVIWSLTETVTPRRMFAVSFGVSLLLAIASWYLVESRFINMKKRIRHEDYPLSEKHTELSRAW